MPRALSAAKLNASGTLKAHPGRYANKPVVDPKPSDVLGYPPKHLPPEIRAIWNEIRSQSLPGTLGNSDRILVEIVCGLVAKLRDDSISAADRSQLIACLGHLGMMPDSRARVTVGPKQVKQEEESPFAGFSQKAA